MTAAGIAVRREQVNSAFYWSWLHVSWEWRAGIQPMSMNDYFRGHMCQACGKQFVFRAHAQDHERNTGHRLFIAEERNSDLFLKAKNAGFNPTITALHKILSVLEQNCLNRTSLSQAANMQYGRLANYLQLLERGKCIQQV